LPSRLPPAAIVVEEGGRIDAVEVIRRTRSPIVIGVDIGSADAWTLRRSAIRSGPDEVIDAILDAIRGDRPAGAPPEGRVDDPSRDSERQEGSAVVPSIGPLGQVIPATLPR
jgi:hypothetical protein